MNELHDDAERMVYVGRTLVFSGRPSETLPTVRQGIIRMLQSGTIPPSQRTHYERILLRSYEAAGSVRQASEDLLDKNGF